MVPDIKKVRKREKMASTEQFSVAEVLRGSFNIIRDKPIILLPQFIVAIILWMPDIIGEFLETNKIFSDLWSLPLYALAPLILFAVVFALLLLFIPAIVNAMYPLLIKNIIEGKEVDFKSVFSAATERALSVVGAMILVELIVIIGLFLFVIPGLIFLAWYYYTIPAIMLKDLGAIEGMSASKDFAKGKKFGTFLLYSIPFFLILLLFGAIIFLDVFMIPVMDWVVVFGIELFLFTWIAVIPAYAYIKYEGKEETMQGAVH